MLSKSEYAKEHLDITAQVQLSFPPGLSARSSAETICLKNSQ